MGALLLPEGAATKKKKRQFTTVARVATEAFPIEGHSKMYHLKVKRSRRASSRGIVTAF